MRESINLCRLVDILNTRRSLTVFQIKNSLNFNDGYATLPMDKCLPSKNIKMHSTRCDAEGIKKKKKKTGKI